MAEVIEKTGLIERSGQGVDIMFTNCIKEGKPLPDYSYSDDYQVDLRFYGEIPDDAFYLFAQDICHQQELESKLLLYKPRVKTVAQRYDISHIQTVYYMIRRKGYASMSDFVATFEGILTQKKVRTLIENLCKAHLIVSHGNARATKYQWI